MMHANRKRFARLLLAALGLVAPTATMSATATLDAATLAREIKAIEQCIARKECFLHLAGSVTQSPELVLSVMPGEYKAWTRDRLWAAHEVGKTWLRWACANPAQAIVKHARIPERAPAFNKALGNVHNIARMSIGPASGRDDKGVPGWLLNEEKPGAVTNYPLKRNCPD